jgi:hypothetical protein
MKNLIKVTLFCLLTISFWGCKKTSVPKGDYSYEWTIITTDSVTFNSCPSNNIYMEVVESNKAYIVFASNDTLYKEGTNVFGTFRSTGATICHGHNTFFGEKHLTGTSRKEKGIHYISGEITTIVYGPKQINDVIIWDTVNAKGTFEIKSNF